MDLDCPALAQPIPSTDARHPRATLNGPRWLPGLLDGPWNVMPLRILDEVDYGLMLVNEKGVVRFANHAALNECSASSEVCVHGGRIWARTRDDQTAFANALAASRQGRRTMLSFGGGRAPLSLACVPIASEEGDDEAWSLLVFGKRTPCETLSVDFYARSHHLTATETSVLKGLCKGLRPAEIAREAGVAISTVRSQIGSIRLKTDTSSIGELVRLVAALPPIVPAINRMSLCGACPEETALAA